MFVLGGIVTHAQQTAVNLEKLKKEDPRNSGIFTFTVSDVSEATLKEKADQYNSYFTLAEVRAQGKGFEVVLIASPNNIMNRRVMMRYFITMGIQDVYCNKQKYSVESFFEKFVI
jgi:hypothetical protein